jgi:hypothetical protein
VAPLEVAMPHRRPNKRTPLEKEAENKLTEWSREQIREEMLDGLAADRRQKEENTWPVNDYVLGAALLLVDVIVLIGIAVATGLVKP